MEKTMKAVVTYAPGDNRYEDFPMPELEDGEVLLKVKGCGICAGDLKTDGLISHCFKLQDWAKAYETAEKDPAAVKIMLEP